MQQFSKYTSEKCLPPYFRSITKVANFSFQKKNKVFAERERGGVGMRKYVYTLCEREKKVSSFLHKGEGERERERKGGKKEK